MTRIKVDKKNKQVIFICKTKGEMQWVLELYGKGAVQTRNEALAVFRTPIEQVNLSVLKELVKHYCHDGDDNSRLDFQNTIMYALKAPNQETAEVRRWWEQFSDEETTKE